MAILCGFDMSIGEIDIANIIDGSHVTMAFRFDVVLKIMMPKFCMEKWKARLRIDLGENFVRREIIGIVVDLDINRHPFSRTTKLRHRWIEVMTATAVLRRKKTQLDSRRIITRDKMVWRLPSVATTSQRSMPKPSILA